MTGLNNNIVMSSDQNECKPHSIVACPYRGKLKNFGPHVSAFEGWYTRFVIPESGASVLFVICSVVEARIRPHVLSLTYVSPEGIAAYEKQLYIPKIERRNGHDTWTAQGSDAERSITGTMTSFEDFTTSYEVDCKDYSLRAETMDQVPFLDGKSNSTPAGWMVNLPLPLHWHVHSLASQGQISLDVPESGVNLRPGTKAIVHQEKNWANSFPRAHMWLQAHTPSEFETQTGAHLCLAGGRVYSFLNAYLLMFRNSDFSIWLRPPLTLGLFGISPLLSTTIDWPNRRFTVMARSWGTRIEIEAQAPPGSFFNLAAPFSQGHMPNALAQSLNAVIEVRVWRKERWFGEWSLATTEVFQRAGLEFGGEYYGDADLPSC